MVLTMIRLLASALSSLFYTGRSEATSAAPVTASPSSPGVWPISS
jgi:hypothetical protein